MTTNQLLILLAIRRLQPCNTRQVADLLGKHYGSINNYFWLGTELKKFADWQPGKANTLRLTDKGRAAIRGYCLIELDGCVKLGKVVRRYD